MKTLKILVLLSLMIVMLPNVKVDAKEKPILSVSTVYESKRTTVDLAVFLQSDVEIASGSFDIQYDPDALTIQDRNVQASSLFVTNDFLTVSNGANAGTVSLAFANEEGAVLDGTLLTFKATLKQVPELVELNFSNVHFYDETGVEIDMVTMNGSIKPFQGNERKHEEKVENMRPWTVTLSSPVRQSSLNEHTVKVLNSLGKPMAIKMEQKSATSFTVSPQAPYTRGTYTLEITDQVLSANGTKLKEPVRHTFTVQ